MKRTLKREFKELEVVEMELIWFNTENKPDNQVDTVMFFILINRAIDTDWNLGMIKLRMLKVSYY